ncbi:uncharacterized protein B0I36DRAFT_354344 [Microdochium trichocladiopsis]|uniref:Isoprenoid synthase domain-containing protein n=1 Tax=Microdochium trichocladiopsis TaxID=1682393 RepID=A0A9P8XTW6_9PEZI|nr:uncharacterized protein B0I36DRAFT_354344 [Microdochium trichocladiopsis]KAH7018023.1 hypothetical protein B0I36DRAFT_354344 [Microdochium trichocladiopsis]
MQKCGSRILQQVRNKSKRYVPGLAEILLTRRDSAGVLPIYRLVEYARSLRLPDEIFELPLIQEMEILGMDMIAISNDMLSYLKEEVGDRNGWSDSTYSGIDSMRPESSELTQPLRF